MTGGPSAARGFLPLMTAAGFSVTMTAPIEVLYARRLGAGALALAVYIAVPGAAVLTVDFFGTRFVPRLDARRALSIGLFVFAISSVLLALSPGWPALLPARAVQGLGSGVFFGSALQGAVRVNPSREQALGRFNGSFTLGSVLGAPAGGLLASVQPGTAGYRVAFFGCAAISLVVSMALRYGLPELPAVGVVRTARLSLPQLSGAPGVTPALVLGMFGDLLRGAVVYTALPLAGQARHLSTVTIGLAVGLLSAVEITTLHVAPRSYARFGLMSCLLGALALGVVDAGFLATSAGPLTFLVGASVFGVVIATAAMVPALLLVSLHDDTASGLASFRVASGFGMLVGSTGAGTVTAAIGASGAFLVIAGVMVGGVALAGTIARTRLRARRGT